MLVDISNKDIQGALSTSSCDDCDPKAIWQCCSDVLGPDALVYEHGYQLRQGSTTAGNSTLQAKYNLLRSRAYSIEGGTSEIMRNILGERVLGLPGEPRVDKNIPWKEVPRS